MVELQPAVAIVEIQKLVYGVYDSVAANYNYSISIAGNKIAP